MRTRRYIHRHTTILTRWRPRVFEKGIIIEWAAALVLWFTSWTMMWSHLWYCWLRLVNLNECDFGTIFEWKMSPVFWWRNHVTIWRIWWRIWWRHCNEVGRSGFGLVVWFLFWVQEVPSSILGSRHPLFLLFLFFSLWPVQQIGHYFGVLAINTYTSV